MSTARVFEELPDLLSALAPEEAARARQTTARVISLPTGAWHFDPVVLGRGGALGLLVLDGMLVREIAVLGTIGSTELLGVGDLLRPWTAQSQNEIDSIPAETRWEVTVPARVAVLDRGFALSVARWPEVAGALVERAVERARATLFQLSVCHVTRVESRLLLTLWHFADRWGRVTRDGVLVPLPLTHRTLASMVGARRPSVTTALGQLRDAGLVQRTGDGWLLHGDPPAELGEIRRAVALPGKLGQGAEGAGGIR
jgi:CRP/FNR family cyclic AMP-dependent transcriptional regulator